MNDRLFAGARDEGQERGTSKYISRVPRVPRPESASSLPAGGSTAPASSGAGRRRTPRPGFARPSSPVARGTWIVWRRDFADSKAGDLELTLPELAAVFVRLGLAETLPDPPRGGRGKAYIRKEDA